MRFSKSLLVTALLAVPALLTAAPTAPDWSDIETALFETATTGWFAVMQPTFVGVGTILVIFWMWRTGKRLIGGRTRSA